MAQMLAGLRPSSGGVAPPVRQRPLDRLSVAAQFPVTLIIAPAGYGKSVLLRQFLEAEPASHVRFPVRAEHGEFLSFLRGFAEALGQFAPHAITSLAGAYERNQSSARRVQDLARWMRAHLDDSFCGTIAIDDLHNGDGDPDIVRFVSALIELCKGKVSWIIASRSISGLPVASWLAYGEADLPIGEADLRFTLEEALEAALEAGLHIGRNEMRNLLHITEGWPAALTFALRTSTRSDDLRSISALTREMIYRFLAEQVYNGLLDEERELLEVALALPSIDVAVLERAGFDRALQIVEGLRERTAFISEESPGVYHCHDLFRDFLRYQGALNGKQAQQNTNLRAARALEMSGDIEHAIAAYVGASAAPDVLRLLEAHGFDLLERAQSDVVTKALDALDETTRHQNAHVLSLLGSIQASAGRFLRAESLLKRALMYGSGDQALTASVSLRLATLYGNAGLSVSSILEPIALDESMHLDFRAEAMSLMVARRMLAGDRDCLRYVPQIEMFLPLLSSDLTRVKVLHHLGIAQRHSGELGKAMKTLHQASGLSNALHMYGIAARVNSVLSNLVLQEYDDERSQLKYSELAASDAARAGDVPTLRTALLQNLSAYVRSGNDRGIETTLDRLSELPLDDAASDLILFFRAVRLSWQGEFAKAHALMSICWERLYLDIDRVSAGAHLALFLALDGRCEQSSRISTQVRRLLQRVEARGPFRSRAITLSIAGVALADVLNGRPTLAKRILNKVKTQDSIERDIREAAEQFIKAYERRVSICQMKPSLERLQSAGYWDATRMLAAVCRHAERRLGALVIPIKLTEAEVEVLTMLGDGIVAKEIALDTGRSVNTVRAHIASAVRKLNCNRQSDAVKAAHRMGIL